MTNSETSRANVQISKIGTLSWSYTGFCPLGCQYTVGESLVSIRDTRFVPFDDLATAASHEEIQKYKQFLAVFLSSELTVW